MDYKATNVVVVRCITWYPLVLYKLITGRPARSAAMPVLFLLSGPKIGFFCPAGATRYPSKREIWHGGADRKFAPPFGPLPVPNFTFIRAEMWEYSPQNCQNFEFWP